MTLQSSGPMSFSEIADEVRDTLPFTIPDARSRWLAEVPSGPVVIPTDFYDKSAVKLVDNFALTNGTSSHSRADVNFGPDYSGRRIVLVLSVSRNEAVPLNISNVSAGGAAGSGDNHGSFDDGMAVGTGMYMANPSGASGTVAFNTANATQAYVWVLSIAGITSRHDYDWSTLLTKPNGIMQLDIPANGVLIACYTRRSSSSNSFDGVDYRADSLFHGGVSRSYLGWTNRLGVQSNRSVSVSPTGSLPRGAIVASFT